MASTLRKHWQQVKKDLPNIEKEKGIKQNLGPKLDETVKLISSFQKADAELLKRWKLVADSWRSCQEAWQEYERKITPSTPTKEFGRQMDMTQQDFKHIAKALADYKQATNGLARHWEH